LLSFATVPGTLGVMVDPIATTMVQLPTMCCLLALLLLMLGITCLLGTFGFVQHTMLGPVRCRFVSGGRVSSFEVFWVELWESAYLVGIPSDGSSLNYTCYVYMYIYIYISTCTESCISDTAIYLCQSGAFLLFAINLYITVCDTFLVYVCGLSPDRTPPL